jgi:hypothetical protein
MSSQFQMHNWAFQAIAQSMFRYTFGIVGSGRFGTEGRGLGTGFGVIWRNRCLILTAAHTLQTTPHDQLYFFLPPDTLQFGDGSLDRKKQVIQKRFTLDNPEVLLAENEDIAAIVLPRQSEETIHDHFIEVAESDTSPSVGTQVGYLGFPAVCKVPFGRNFMAQPYSDFGEICPQTANDEDTVVITYERATELDPHGLSGSGIWHSRSSGKIWAPRLALAGMVTHYDEEAKLLAGYRIETLVRFLKTNNPRPTSGLV